MSHYTKFNISTLTCDATLEVKDCQQACGGQFRISPINKEQNKFYFCPGELANCNNIGKNDTSCWIISCAAQNRSYRIDENYLFLCIEDHPHLENSNNSNILLSSSILLIAIILITLLF